MSVESPGDRPLDLRDLAAEESPDVVRVALKRFRRRTAVRAVWLAGIALAALLIIPLLSEEEPFQDRYYAADGLPIGASAESGSVRVTLVDGRRIDPDTGGLRFIATSVDPSVFLEITAIRFEPPGEPPKHRIAMEHPFLNAGEFRAEAFAVVPIHAEGISLDRVFVSVSVVTSGSGPAPPVTVSFDLSRVKGLADFYWR